MIIKQILPIECDLPVDQLEALKSRKFELAFFDERTVAFLDNVASRILKDTNINRIPEIAALGFWLRRANLKRIAAQNNHLSDQSTFINTPLGVMFHICPSNVDTMFMYSLALSLAVGNKNIVRIPSRLTTGAISRIFSHMRQAIVESSQIFSNYINLITYGHEEDINNYLSSESDGRIVWGGDETVNMFRSFKTKPRSREVVFPDRVSISLIKSSEYLGIPDSDKAEFAEKFYNDAFTFDQMGCSSPQSVVFYGKESDSIQARTSFYDSLLPVVKRKYTISDYYSLASLKLNFLMEDIINGSVSEYRGDEIRLMFVDAAKQDLEKHSGGGGYFYIHYIKDLSALASHTGDKLQTIGYFGLSRAEIHSLQQALMGKGVDRIVPIGQALAFDYLWDGYNLVEMLSKRLAIV